MPESRSDSRERISARLRRRPGPEANPSAFIRAAIRNELDGRAELTGTDERMGAGFDRVSRDIFRVGRGQQALYSLLDALAKAILTCVPEPPPDARQQAVARAK